MFKTEFRSRRDEYIELWIFRGNTKQDPPPPPGQNGIKKLALKRLVNIFENTTKGGSTRHLAPKSAPAKLHCRLVFFVCFALELQL